MVFSGRKITAAIVFLTENSESEPRYAKEMGSVDTRLSYSGIDTTFIMKPMDTSYVNENTWHRYRRNIHRYLFSQ
jgi:hypothetical protein